MTQSDPTLKSNEIEKHIMEKPYLDERDFPNPEVPHFEELDEQCLSEYELARIGQRKFNE